MSVATLTGQLTGRRGRIQSAWSEWTETAEKPSYFLSDAVYNAVLENEADFDGLEAAVKAGILEWASSPGQDFVEVLYYAIERAQRSAESTWTGPGSGVGSLPYSRPNAGY